MAVGIHETTGNTLAMSPTTNIQQIVDAVVQVLQRTSPSTLVARANDIDSSPSGRSSGDGAAHVWQSVKCAEKLIPPFAGKEEENVLRWLERVTSIARTYKFTDDVLLLATVSQLKERAQKWYNRQPLDSVSTWEEFKFQLRRYFERKESYSATLARISSRIWKSHTEKFIEYAEAKLNLMQLLSLSEREKIELLADGVKDFHLRRMVLNIWIENVSDFIDHVRRITEDSVIMRRGELPKYTARRANGTSSSTDAEKTCFTCKKSGHLSKDCRIAKVTCFKCGRTGHLSTTCPRKENRQVATLNPEEQVASSSTTEQLMAPYPTKDVLQIGTTSGAKSCVQIRRANNEKTQIRALIDTGSPVNLIKKSVYEKFFGNRELLKVKKESSYKGINESPILIYGKIYDQIILDDIKDTWFDITFLVVDDKTMRHDIIIGCEFINNANLRLIYYKNNFVFELIDDFNAVAQDIFTINIVEPREQWDIIAEYLDKDLSMHEKNRLLKVFEEVESKKIEKIEDDHNVQIYLKDKSLFKYAPRRMSYSEKEDLQKIVDDLLNRNIIKTSISPYCSRVILVTRRNGKKRICVDLRPLNQRIYPQKYPFPIIDDQLDKLGNKQIFTKLDLKDGFHQLSIYSEHTKYFSFATPSGQYEFIKMPFGYSEAPAEFQKRVLQIFEQMTRANKILIYIDDILIPTTTVV